MFRINRRQWVSSAASFIGASASGWLPILAAQTANDPRRKRHCILLWMTGGPSQTDTFDMKPNHTNGGEFAEIATSVPGLRFSEHLPQLAKQADQLAVVRGLSTKEGDHGRGTYLMRTGQRPQSPIQYPTIGSSISKELATHEGIPNFVSIAPYRAFNQAAYGPGFLGPKYAPLTVGASDAFQAPPPNADGYAELRVDDLRPAAGVSAQNLAGRLRLWRTLQDRFLADHPSAAPIAHNTIYEHALQLMDSEVAKAFDLSQESAAVRDAYGRGRFGQGCLMARRLVESGVAFVEVSLGGVGGGSLGWDTHTNNFPAVETLSAELDAGWGTLMRELAERGLLESTTIVWMGEFGRTPAINRNAGRDHFPAAWTAVLAGGGIAGGQAYGRTSDDGTTVEEGQVAQGDLLATLCAALGIDPEHENISAMGRPIKIAEGKPIRSILRA